MSSDQEQQKWKMYNNVFENVTLKQREEGGDRWDICGDEDILEMIGNHAQLTIHMKSSVEENEFYSKVTSVHYRGQKVTCDKGKLCLVIGLRFHNCCAWGSITTCMIMVTITTTSVVDHAKNSEYAYKYCCELLLGVESEFELVLE